ncbi:hypothetical protein [Kitasatospora paranensis]|uniref:Uncharacterized protein n=1 Tax=Kitasatospora paranensis TaxID=258053 RepID=A0ABW2FQT6_9ACTN
MSLTPERLAQILALGDDELRTDGDTMDAIEDLLTEVDNLRASLLSLSVLLNNTAYTVEAGRTTDAAALRHAAGVAYEQTGGPQ